MSKVGRKPKTKKTKNKVTPITQPDPVVDTTASLPFTGTVLGIFPSFPFQNNNGMLLLMVHGNGFMHPGGTIKFIPKDQAAT